MIGYVAAILVTIAYLPEAVHTFKTKVCCLSWATLLILMSAMLLWSIHAIDNNDWSLLASSMFSFMQLMFLSLYKIRRT
jgi:uncharacterized protein with PQ loop repeat